MNDFPTARDAREKLNRNKQANADAELVSLRNRITRAIEIGHDSVTVVTLTTETQKRLQDLGYTVKHNPGSYDPREREQFDGSWTVSW